MEKETSVIEIVDPQGIFKMLKFINSLLTRELASKKAVVLDFTKLSSLDPQGISALSQIQLCLEEKGKKLYLRAAGNLLNILKNGGFEDIILQQKGATSPTPVVSKGATSPTPVVSKGATATAQAVSKGFCYNHKNVTAIAYCNQCEKGLCEACIVARGDGGSIFCSSECLDKFIEESKRDDKVIHTRYAELEASRAKIWYILGSIVAILLIGGVYLAIQTKRAQDFFMQGKQEITKKGSIIRNPTPVRKRIAFLENAMSIWGTTDYRRELALTYLEAKDEDPNYIKLAYENFKAVCEDDPSNIISQRGLACAALELDKLEEAEKYFQQLSNSTVKDPLVFYSLGKIYYKKGDYNKARTYLNDIDEKNVEGLILLADIYDKKLKESAKAIPVYEKLLRLESRDEIRTRLIEIYKENKQYVDMIPHLNILIKSNVNPQMISDLMEAYNQSKNLSNAIKSFEDIYQLHKNKEKAIVSEILSAMSSLYLKQDNYEKALKSLRELTKVNPTDISAYQDQLQILTLFERWKEAKETSEALLKLPQYPPEALSIYVESCIHTDSPEEARKALINCSIPEEKLILESKILEAENKLDKAIDKCREAIKVSPNLKTGVIQLGGLLFQKGNYSEAIEYLSKTGTEESVPQIDYLLASIYLKLGWEEKAKEKLSKAKEQKKDMYGIKSNCLLKYLQGETSLFQSPIITEMDACIKNEEVTKYPLSWLYGTNRGVDLAISVLSKSKDEESNKLLEDELNKVQKDSPWARYRVNQTANLRGTILFLRKEKVPSDVLDKFSSELSTRAISRLTNFENLILRTCSPDTKDKLNEITTYYKKEIGSEKNPWRINILSLQGISEMMNLVLDNGISKELMKKALKLSLLSVDYIEEYAQNLQVTAGLLAYFIQRSPKFYLVRPLFEQTQNEYLKSSESDDNALDKCASCTNFIYGLLSTLTSLECFAPQLK